MAKYRAKCTEQSARGKEHILSLRGEAEAISKCEIPRGVYPEPSDKILRYAQNDRRRRARNDKLQVLTNQKGIALVMVLVISAIALAIMAGLIYMITSGTQISGMQKKYKTALEAGLGGADITYQLIALRGETSATDNFRSTLPTLSIFITTPNTCVTRSITKCTTIGSYTGIATKFNLPTECWSGCDSVSTFDPATPGTYDMRFDLGMAPTYRGFAKIVDTTLGNSGGDEGLLKTGVVLTNPGEVTVVSVPYFYTIEVDAENQANPAERAKLSILYQY
ncbi:MAG: hypothetical protein NT055_02225 [Nitrospirae bacterium]|nr:hypothetical protein [Nitrospirota bacterium]